MSVTPEQWVEALKSGEYTPAVGSLVVYEDRPDGWEGDPKGHCCIGVLAKLCGYLDSDLSDYNEWPYHHIVSVKNDWEVEESLRDDPDEPSGPPEWLTP